uniref:Uncharacterized protein n=1 Tax=Aegilops tauschii subsp. strangulata TaxID=200361 RepID=A0A453LHT4_AEGTS
LADGIMFLSCSGVPGRRELQEAAGVRPRVPPGVHRQLAPVEAPLPHVPPRRLLAYPPAAAGEQTNGGTTYGGVAADEA